MPELLSRLGLLVADLKRRGVLRVAAVYLVGAWVVIQVADVTFPRLGLPSWTVTFVIVAGALLFPVVMGLAWAFDLTARGLERTAPLEPLPAHAAMQAPKATRQHRRFTLLGAALMTLPLVGFGLWYVNDARGYSLDADLVAVTPFRVAGAAPDAHYLREGLMDLIAARLGGGDGELAVVAPRTMSRTLKDKLGSIDADPDRLEALELARELGAGRLLQGEVIGDANRVTVTASLYDTFTGDRIGAPASIAAHPDSIYRIVDQLATRLVAASAGVTGDQLAHLTTESVPALRAFLEAEAAFRRGDHRTALRGFDQAVSLDTTFALAAVGLLRAQGWAPGAPAQNGWGRAAEIARRGLDRLSERDRLYFDSFTGGVDRANLPLREFLTRRLRAAERMPDAADLRYLAGDALFHWGEALSLPNARDRARALFEETVAMDSVYLEPLAHLHDMALQAGDTAAVRRWGGLLLAIDSSSNIGLSVRYARSLGHAGAGQTGETFDFDTLSVTQLTRLSAGPGNAPAEALVQEILEQFDTVTLPDEKATVAGSVQRLGMRLGRPSVYERGLAAEDPSWELIDRMGRAIYWLRDGDAVRASLAPLREETARLRGTNAPMGEIAPRECILGHAELALGELDAAARQADVLERVPARDDVGTQDEDTRVCIQYLRTAIALYGNAPGARGRLEMLDDTIGDGVVSDQYMNQIYQLAIARLWEEAGEPDRALEAVRRRIYLPWATFWHTEMIGEEARLADQLGRRQEAIDAYRRYLAYREAPEPPFDERASRARERLAVLVGEGRR